VGCEGSPDVPVALDVPILPIFTGVLIMSKARNIRKHLNALSVPQLKALAIVRADLNSSVAAAMPKEALVTILRDVPNVLMPTPA